MNTLSPEVKAAWLAALRSGEFRQGEGSLRMNDNRYCCLGVYAEVVDATWEPAGFRQAVIGPFGATYVAFLPEQWVSGDVQRVLATMNDEGRSFEDIADWIEENL